MSDVLVARALQDKSFAGPFAYENSSVNKVFAGDTPKVPPEVLLKSFQVQLGESIVGSSLLAKAPQCFSHCESQYHACLQHGTPSVDTWSSCKASASMCLLSCAMKQQQQ